MQTCIAHSLVPRSISSLSVTTESWGGAWTLHTHIWTYYIHTTTHIQGGEGQTILNRELSECAVIRLSPERIQQGDEDQDGGVALLRSRVEQQSTLIAMLKQRGDETLREVSVG